MPRPLLVVDAPHLLYRAFFALPDSITGAGRPPVNALLGSVNQSCRCVEQLRRRARSCCCFGAEAADYRTEAYPAYHAAPPADARRPRRRSGSARRRSTRRSAGPCCDHDDARGRRPAAARSRAPRRAAGGTALILTGDRDMFQCVDRRRHGPAAARRQEGPDEIGPGRGARALRHRARAGARLHRAARRPVRRAAGRQGHRREDRGRPAPAQGRPRARDPRRDPREAVACAAR